MNGKLLFCHPPPGIEADDFNAETRDLELLRAQNKLRQKMGPTTRVGKGSDYFVHNPSAPGMTAKADAPRGKGQSAKANALDSSFFASNVGNGVIIGTKGTKTQNGGEGKKHYKKKREKQRSGRGYDE